MIGHGIAVTGYSDNQSAFTYSFWLRHWFRRDTLEHPSDIFDRRRLASACRSLKRHDIRARAGALLRRHGFRLARLKTIHALQQAD